MKSSQHVMPHSKNFCNSPWYELHIFWDGSFGYCCAQTPHRPYSSELRSFYNIKVMSMFDWHNSQPMKKVRLSMLDEKRMPECALCWHLEKFSNTSRRHKSNIKSVIFKEKFNESFKQSPNFATFNYSFKNHGVSKQLPVDLHIDLGNYCNLACKFCSPEASSKIAKQYSEWEVFDQNILVDWTKDDTVWNNFTKQVVEIPNLQNIHFMGGETLITKRFEDLLDVLIKNSRFDVCLSFVTNGTVFNENIINKLTKFKRTGIEVSIESTTIHNEYIRQGTKNSIVINNILKFNKLAQSTSIDITIRPAISLLSIGYYWTLLEFCLKNKLLIKSNNVIREVGINSTKCLDVRMLPNNVKQAYKIQYQQIKEKIDANTRDEFNESDPNNYQKVIKKECDACLELLSSKNSINNNKLYDDLVLLLQKWDKVYKFNACELYPELIPLLTKFNYNVSD